MTEPLTSRQEYLGQSREPDPQQVMASRIDALDAQERAEDAQDRQQARVDVGEPSDPAEGLWPDPCPPFTYLAGTAGSGKTFATKAWAERERGLLLCATTGIAAINLGGTTINAVLGYFDTSSLQDRFLTGGLTARLGRLWKSGVRRLVVDEVSMLAGDQLTYLVKAIEEVNGRGYVLGKWDQEDDTPPPAMGLTLVGDFGQLAPVKAPFAWESPEWGRFAEPGHTITLTAIRRQADPDFIRALRAARVGNGQVVHDYFAPTLQATLDDRFEGPTIFAKNDAVDRYNWLRLGAVPGSDLYFESRREGKQRSEWGDPKKAPATWGIPLRLHLKVGALVMVLANERDDGPPPQPFVYVNGDLGTVVDATATSVTVRLQRTGQEVSVSYTRREVLEPCDAARRRQLRAEGQDHRISENGKWEVMGWVEYLPLRVAYASTVHKCVAGDAKVLVYKRGAIPIEQVRVGEYVDTGFGPARLIASKQTYQEAYRLTTARGYSIVCSADHRWMSNDDLVETQKLRTGSRILLAQETTVEGTHEIDADVAWWIGACLGDANWSDRREGQIHFANIDQGLRQRWMQIAQRLGGRPNTRRDKRGCHLTSLPMRLRLMAWGCPCVTTISKRVPRVIWESGQSAWGACLQGLFDTDGSMLGHRLLFANRSIGLIQDVQLLLLYLGIPSTLGTYEGRTGPYYHVRISAEGRTRFAARVGFSHAKKQRALEAWKPNRELKPYDGTDTVRRIEHLKIAIPMFDVELNAIHRLSFGPFMGSNSQGLSLDQVQVNIADHFFGSSGMLYVALSRARTADGLRLVGQTRHLIERCAADPRLRAWL